MGVLAAVLPHAGHVTFDVARIQSRFVERRSQELDQPASAADQAFIDGVHRARAPVASCGTREHRPALRDRIDLAFGIRGDPSGVPSSKYARRYHSPSQPCCSMFALKAQGLALHCSANGHRRARLQVAERDQHS